MKLHIRYNSPVILTFALLCAAVLLIDQVSGGWLIRSFFTLQPDFNARIFSLLDAAVHIRHWPPELGAPDQ